MWRGPDQPGQLWLQNIIPLPPDSAQSSNMNMNDVPGIFTFDGGNTETLHNLVVSRELGDNY